MHTDSEIHQHRGLKKVTSVAWSIFSITSYVLNINLILDVNYKQFYFFLCLELFYQIFDSLTGTKENHFTSINFLFLLAILQKKSYIKTASILCQLFQRLFIKLSFWGLNLEFYKNKIEDIHFKSLLSANRGSK